MKIIGKIISIIVILIVCLLVGSYLWNKYDFWKEMKWYDEEKDKTNKDIVKVEKFLDDAKELLKDKTKELADKEQEKKDKEKEKEDLGKEDKDLEGGIKTINTQIDVNQKIIDDPKTPPKEKQEKIDENIDLRNQVAIMNQRREAIKIKRIEIDARIDEINSEIDSIKAEIRELESFITQLENTLLQMRIYLRELENCQEKARERENRNWLEKPIRTATQGLLNLCTAFQLTDKISNACGVGPIKRPVNGIVCTPEQLTVQMQNIKEQENKKSALNKDIRTNKSKLTNNQTSKNKLNNLNVN